MVNTNVADYLLPADADVRETQAIMGENDEFNPNPLGTKGIGELPMLAAARRGGKRGPPRDRGT